MYLFIMLEWVVLIFMCFSLLMIVFALGYVRLFLFMIGSARLFAFGGWIHLIVFRIARVRDIFFGIFVRVRNGVVVTNRCFIRFTIFVISFNLF